MTQKSIIIIGAGIAGLSAGCYARMNGYDTIIYEKHDLPGGLCTTWKRKGYKIDGSIHYLIGSGPGSSFHQYWREVGAIQGRSFIDHEALMAAEDLQGRKLVLYANPDRLEKHLIELSPADRPVIQDLIEGIKFFNSYSMPVDTVPELMGPLEGIRMLVKMAPSMGAIQKWSRMTIKDFAARFQDSLLRDALRDCLRPEFPMLIFLTLLAGMNQKSAGYPAGGSLSLARAIEKRFLDLGGKIEYLRPVKKILVENNHAVGVLLEDKSEQRADTVISAADGHATIFKLLNGKYVDKEIVRCYQETQPFPGLIYINFGIDRQWNEIQTSSGISYPLRKPVQIGNQSWDRLFLRARSHEADPDLVPAGKSLLTISGWTSHAYWKELAVDAEAYQAKKLEILEIVTGLLEERYPGIGQQIEMTDFATPLTFERYTGNWQGSTQGWLPTPQNALLQMKKTLPGLENFYLIGQWVEPGGGLPAGLRSGRNVIRILCKQDGIRFAARED